MNNSGELKINDIPNYVISWTDRYFHQSAFDIPLAFPNKKIISFLSRFRKNEKVVLFRGINKFNDENFTGIESWSYDKNIAKRYANEQGGGIVKKIFDKDDVFLDTTLLDERLKKYLGYDYKTEDEEVLIFKK